jgi:hypothetical protein
MYQVKQRSPLGDTFVHCEVYSFQNALRVALEVNANRSRSMKAYPAYIYEVDTQRVIKPTKRPAYFYARFVDGHYQQDGDYEIFSSLKAIKAELFERLNNQRRYPCVDERSSFEVYYGNPKEDRYMSPDVRIHFGERGGIRITRYL